MTHKMEYIVKQLQNRNITTLPAFAKSVDDLSDELAGHLKAMGLEYIQ